MPMLCQPPGKASPQALYHLRIMLFCLLLLVVSSKTWLVIHPSLFRKARPMDWDGLFALDAKFLFHRIESVHVTKILRDQLPLPAFPQGFFHLL